MPTIAATMAMHVAATARSRVNTVRFSPFPPPAVIGLTLLRKSAASKRPVEDVAAETDNRRDIKQRHEPAERQRDGERAHPLALPPAALPLLLAVAVHYERHRDLPQAINRPTACSTSSTAKRRNRYRIENPNNWRAALSPSRP